MTAILLFIDQEDDNRRYILTNVSVGIAVATFILIMVYQIYKRVSKTRQWKKLISWLRSKQSWHRSLNDEGVVVDENASLLGPHQRRLMPQVANFSVVREPLLMDD